MTLALLLILAQPYPANPTVKQGISRDGGVSWPVEIVGGPGTSADSSLASELRDGTPWVRVRNMPPPPKRNPLNGAAYVDGSKAVQPVSASTLPLPAGAATEATLATMLTSSTFSASFGLLGQKTMAGSAPVVIASDQAALPVTGTFWQVTQPISAATLPLPTGAATDQTLAMMVDGGVVSLGRAPNGQNVPTLVDQMGSAIVLARPIPPLNPFLQRCNAVRKTGCQP